MTRVETRLKAATPGPWKPDDITVEVLDDYKAFYWNGCPHGCAEDDCEGHFEERAFMIHGIGHVPNNGDEGWYFNEGDADFISHSKDDMAYLLEMVALNRVQAPAWTYPRVPREAPE